jgi:hypothetical protein
MRMLPIRNFLLSLVATLVLAGCAVGTEFVRPAPDAIQLGKTTYKEVVERLGAPNEEKRLRYNNRPLRSISYSYIGEVEVPKVPNTMGGRELSFLLSGDVVVAERFMSSYASDSTDFDEHKVDDIVKGKTRCDEVVAMFGRPCARAIYPAVDEEGESVVGYVFEYMKRPLLQFKMFRKSLVVYCDAPGVVKDVSYTEVGDR